MEITLPYVSLSLFSLLTAFIIFLSHKTRRHRRHLPPSPPSLPLIGHLHLLRKPVHQTFHKLSQTLGPVFSLQLGSQLAVVISSSLAAEECFTKNDVVLANRPRLIAGKYFGYNFTTVAASQYGDHWRNLRRLMSLEIFSTARLNSFLSIRKDEVRRLLHRLYKKSLNGFARVELESMLMDLTFNNVMRMIAGKRYYGEDLENSAEAEEFRSLMKEAVKAGGASNPADYLPILRWIDCKGFEKNLAKIHARYDKLLQGLIDEHRRDKSKSTMIDHLLSLQESQPEYYTDEIIKGIITAMIFAGTDTSVATMEWAMSFLLNHPKVLMKAKDELDAQVGQDCQIDEHDLSKLPYLQAIISETLRLRPAAPMLLPHMSSDDCTIASYRVPRGTLLLVNAWAIQRDPNVWDDPTSFKPERFEGGEVEGQKLMAFGLGRRACPGEGLAQRVMGLALGSLIQCFEWERVDKDLVNMNEGKGAILHKAEPLEAMCKARDVTKKVFSAKDA